jgi:predicted permease
MDAATAFAVTGALLALGKFAAWRWHVAARVPDAFNQIVLYLCLPAAVLRNAPKLEFSAALLGLALLPWLLLGVSALAVLVVARALRLPEGVRGVLLLAVPLGNTSFLGYPLVEALLGSAALPYAVAYDQLGSFLILSTYGLVVLAWHAHGAAPSAREIVARILRFPPFLAVVVALLAMPRTLPPALDALLAGLASLMLPLVALALGMQLKFRLPAAERTPLALGLAGKMLLLPLLALAVAPLLGLEGSMRAVAVLQSGMPTMVTAMALAAGAGLAPTLAAALVGYGVLLAALTLPLLRWLLG